MGSTAIQVYLDRNKAKSKSYNTPNWVVAVPNLREYYAAQMRFFVYWCSPEFGPISPLSQARQERIHRPKGRKLYIRRFFKKWHKIIKEYKLEGDNNFWFGLVKHPGLDKVERKGDSSHVYTLRGENFWKTQRRISFRKWKPVQIFTAKTFLWCRNKNGTSAESIEVTEELTSAYK